VSSNRKTWDHCLALLKVTAKPKMSWRKTRVHRKIDRGISAELQRQGLPRLPPWPCAQQLLSDVAPPCRSCSCAETEKRRFAMLQLLFSHGTMSINNFTSNASLAHNSGYCFDPASLTRGLPFERKTGKIN
jgi:hypothetical protein